MHVPTWLVSLPLLLAAVGAAAQETAIANPRIDMAGHLAAVQAAAAHREPRLVDEATFLRMAAEPGTVVLDARSAQRYAELHVAGAINLPFPDITEDSLARLLPDRATRVLIYCNNNFAGAERAFPIKRIEAALNLSTYTTLYAYGYRNVFELGPNVDINASVLPFEGKLALAPAP